jgi:hypothetical protein
MIVDFGFLNEEGGCGSGVRADASNPGYFSPQSREGRQGNAKSFKNRDQDSLKRATTDTA